MAAHFRRLPTAASTWASPPPRASRPPSGHSARTTGSRCCRQAIRWRCLQHGPLPSHGSRGALRTGDRWLHDPRRLPGRASCSALAARAHRGARPGQRLRDGARGPRRRGSAGTDASGGSARLARAAADGGAAPLLRPQVQRDGAAEPGDGALSRACDELRGGGGGPAAAGAVTRAGGSGSR